MKIKKNVHINICLETNDILVEILYSTNKLTMYYFTYKWYNIFATHISSLVSVEFLLFINSKPTPKTSSTWIRARKGTSNPGLSLNSNIPLRLRMVWQTLNLSWWNVCLFKLQLNIKWILNVPMDKNPDGLSWANVGLISKSKCLWTYFDVNFFAVLIRELTPVIRVYVSNHFRHKLYR
jgi:hypothetical protein